MSSAENESREGASSAKGSGLGGGGAAGAGGGAKADVNALADAGGASKMLPLAGAPVAQFATGADGRLALNAALANEKLDELGAGAGAC